jgi:hypothetical protein
LIDPGAELLYRDAAERGDAKAQYFLGVLYANGHGVRWNYIEAYKWFLLAAERGNKNAGEVLGIIKSYMDDGGLREARRRTYIWRRTR